MIVNDFRDLAEAQRDDRYRSFRTAELAGLTRRDMWQVPSGPAHQRTWWRRLGWRHGGYAYTS